MFDALGLPLWVNLALFAVAAVAIWVTGTRMATYADEISDRTGLGHAFIGVVFLATASSLPDGASVVSAASTGDAPLAVNNLLGGLVMQTAILAVADKVGGGKALTHFVAKSVLLLEGLLVVMLLGIALTGIGVGDTDLVRGIGIWPLIIAAVYLVGLYLVFIYQRREKWQAVHPDASEVSTGDESSDDRYVGWSNRRVYLAFAGGAVIILVAGTIVGRTGDAIASQTGLGGSFTGVTLLALATSLPELSTTLSAVRIGAYSLAVSNVFGSTMLQPALLLPADLVYRDAPILTEIGRDAILSAGAGIIVTSIYLVGLLERRDRTIGGIGLDSAAVLIVYALVLIGQYLLR